MATFQEVRVSLQGINFLDSARKSLRFESQSYLATLDAGTVIVNGVPMPALGVVQDLITKNRPRFAAQVDQYQAFVADLSKRAAFVNGLAAQGLALGEINTLVTALQSGITTHQQADISTEPLIRTMATAVLAAVPAYFSIIAEV